MTTPQFTAEEVLHTVIFRGSKIGRYFISKNLRQMNSKPKVSQSYIRDYAGYTKCWQSCWASKGYSDKAVDDCKVACGGPR